MILYDPDLLEYRCLTVVLGSLAVSTRLCHSFDAKLYLECASKLNPKTEPWPGTAFKLKNLLVQENVLLLEVHGKKIMKLFYPK